MGDIVNLLNHLAVMIKTSRPRPNGWRLGLGPRPRPRPKKTIKTVSRWDTVLRLNVTDYKSCLNTFTVCPPGNVGQVVT